MKWRSSYLTELQKSLRPGAKAELVTARKMFGNRKSIGLGTIASYRMDPKQRMQRIHYAMACAKWGTLSSGDKAAYTTWADDNKVTVFSSFLHSYLTELKEDLVLYLPMEKITGTTVKDYSKYANDGTETDTSIITNGQVGKALDFNGSTSKIVVGHDASLSIADGLSINVWVKVPNVVGDRAFISKYVHNTLLANYLFYSTGANVVFSGYVGGVYKEAPFVGGLTASKFHMFTGTNDGTNLKIYHNGVLKNTAASGSLDTNTNDLYLGMRDYVGSEMYHQGTLDEPRIYKKTLIVEEIRAMYKQESKWHGDVA